MREKSLYPESRILVVLFTISILLISTTSVVQISHLGDTSREALSVIIDSPKPVIMDSTNPISDFTIDELEANMDYQMGTPSFEDVTTIIPRYPANYEHPLRGSLALDISPLKPRLDALTIHGPIQIFNDTDFITQGWPGLGIPGDPFVISDLEITTLGDGRDCIEIRNTRANFRIQGCHLIGLLFGGNKFVTNGVKLYNVSNGQIWGNEINEHGDPGIQLSNSSFCDVDGNTCYDNEWGGVNLSNSFNNHVTDNNCIGEDHHGMVISDSGSNIIFGNDVSSSDWKAGLFIKDCPDGNNSISFNTANGCDHGIAVVDSSYNRVFNNTCNNNDISGIYLGEYEYWSPPTHNLVANNTCNNNVIAGIKVVNNSHSNTVVNNTCTNNEKGLHLNSAYYNEITMNIVDGNDLPIHVKDGAGNTLSQNSCVSTGNGIHIEDSNDNIVTDQSCSSNVCGLLIESSDNNTLDGNDLINNDWGVYANHSTNLNIIDCQFNGNEYGILLEEDSDNCTIEYNNCSFNVYGMDISSDYSVIKNNLCANNTWYGLYVGATDYCDIMYNTCSNNTGSGIVFCYTDWCVVQDNICENNEDSGIKSGAFSSHNTIIDNLCENNPRNIFLEISDRNLVANNTCRFGNTGIKLDYAWLNTIADNICTNCTTGIRLVDESRKPVIEDNLCKFNDYGIEITQNSYEGTIENNICDHNDFGIYVKNSNGYSITMNLCNNGQTGIFLRNTNSTTLSDNTCSSNTDGIHVENLISSAITCNDVTFSDVGVALSNANTSLVGNNSITDCINGLILYANASSNTFNWNIYEDNTENAIDNGTGNNVNYNYWSEYGGVDANADGFGDTPYPISGSTGNQDNYPLVYHPTYPEWVAEPSDCYLECGNNFSYDVDATATTPIRWWLSDEVNFEIDVDGVIENRTFLPYGNYSLEIRAYNLYNGSCSATITVVVDDTTLPVINHPEDIEAESNIGIIVTWTVFDLNPMHCIFETTYAQSEWLDWDDQSQTISVDLSSYNLQAGTHNLTLFLRDAAGNNVTDVVQFTITYVTTETTTDTTSTTTNGGFDITTLAIFVGIGSIAVVVIVILIRKKGG